MLKGKVTSQYLKVFIMKLKLKKMIECGYFTILKVQKLVAELGMDIYPEDIHIMRKV